MAACLLLLLVAAALIALPTPAGKAAQAAAAVMTVNDITRPEGDAGVSDFAFEVTLTCNGSIVPFAGVTDVDYTTVDGTAPRNAVKDEDYTETHGTLHFDFGTPPSDAGCGAQRRTQTVHVPVQGDTDPERTESFFLVLTPKDDIAEPKTVAGTLVNDDGPSVSIADSSVERPTAGAKAMSFAVTLSEAVPNVAMSVDYDLVPGTAQGGQDYAPLTGASDSGRPGAATLTFAPGTKTATIDIPVYGDTLSAADQTFGVRLFNADFKQIARGEATGTIVTKNPVPVLTVSDPWVTEGTGPDPATLSFTLSLPPPYSKQAVSVTYTTADGTAIAGEDYTAKTGTATIEPYLPATTITVPIVADSAVEPNETFSLVLSNPQHATLAQTTVPGTIVNDDGRAFTFSLSGSGNAPVSGEEVTVTVTAKESNAAGAATDATYIGIPSLSAPDDTHFSAGSCGVAVAGVSTCHGVVFGDLGAQHLVASPGVGAVEPNGTTVVGVQPTGLRLQAAESTVHAGYPLRFTATPTAGVTGAAIDGYTAPRTLAVAGEGKASSPANGAALACPHAVCAFDVTFPDAGARTVAVKDNGSPSRTSAALPVSVTPAATPPPGPPAGELTLPLVAKLDLFDSAGSRLSDGETTTLNETSVRTPPPAPRQIASALAVDPALRLLLATGPGAPQVSVVNLDSLKQVDAVPMNFGTATAPVGPGALLVDQTRHLAFARSGAKLATFSLVTTSAPKLFTLPTEVAVPGTIPFDAKLAISTARGALYVLTNEPDGVKVHAYDVAKLAAGTAPELWSYALPPSRCNAAPRGLGFDEAHGALYFYCIVSPNFTVTVPTKPNAVARLALAPTAASSPESAEFVPMAADTTKEILSPLDGRLTEMKLASGAGGVLPGPWAGVTFDTAHGAFLGPNNVTTAGAIGNGVTWSTELGRNYFIASGRQVQTTDPLDGHAQRMLVPTTLTASQAGRLPVDNGVAYPILDGYMPVDAAQPMATSAFDPVTRRIFLFGSGYSRPTDRFEVDGQGARHQVIQTLPSHPVFVLQDRLPAPPPAAVADPDADTHHEAEIPGRTPVSYSGGASAYGAVRRSLGGEPGVGSSSFDRPGPGVTSAWVRTSRLSGSGASATAVGTALDEAFAQEIADNGGPAPETMSDQYVPSQCGDFGDAPRTVTKQGSSVSCNLAQTRVEASATEDPEANGPVPAEDGVDVGSSASWTTLTRDPEKGTVARAEAIARDITIGGVLHIGEVHTVATSVAHGQTGSAASTFTASVKHAILTDPTGAELYRCEECDPATLADKINSLAGTNGLTARAGAPDPNQLIRNSPGGAQAAIQKAPYDYWNDFYSYADESKSVYGLEVFLNRTGTDVSANQRGVLLQLAGTAVDAHYVTGVRLPEEVVQPGSLKILLLDGDIDAVPVPKPLSGATFEVYADNDGDEVLGAGDALIDDGTCATAQDGIGTCNFADLAPGGYLVHEKSPPAGYAGAPDAAVLVESGNETLLHVSNPKAVGRIAISLTDAAASPHALAGGVFELYADDGDGALGAADVLKGTCTTDAEGDCPAFLDMALGTYVVHEKTPPAGYLGAPDAAFALTLPGQLAHSKFVNPKGVGIVAISAADDRTPPEPVAGALFELYKDDGDGVLGAADVLRGSCTTTEAGNCSPFEDVPLGKYVVHEKTVPAGYLGAPDAAFSLTKASETARAEFVNPRAIGRVEVSVADAAEQPHPLRGGVFELYKDDGDGVLGAADVLRGTCTTTDGGECPAFLDVPLGKYVVHEKQAPQGYALGDDAAFSLTKAQETAKVGFVNPKEVGRVEVSVADDATTPKPLAGGVFELYADDGDGVLGAADTKVDACTTNSAGTCAAFVDVPLGKYLVHEKAAPAGYAEADDAAFSLTKPDEIAVVSFVNPRAIGTINVSVVDTSEPPKPLAGAVFELYADDGDGVLRAIDRKVGSCTTDGAGKCAAFTDVPLGAYVVHQQSAPEGYVAADDVQFALREPGETVDVAFVDGTPGTPDVPGSAASSSDSEGTPATPPQFIPGEAAQEPQYATEVITLPRENGPEPIVNVEPAVESGSGPGQFFAPAARSAWKLLRRTPLQALLFAFVWVLFGTPAYLGARRYRLSRIRGGI